MFKEFRNGLVCGYGENYREKGYDIATDEDCSFDDDIELPKFSDHPPGCSEEEIGTPDVYAEKKGEPPEIVEIVTGEIDKEHIKCRLKTFTKHGHTIICIPEEKKQEIEKLLTKWKLPNITIHTYR